MSTKFSAFANATNASYPTPVGLQAGANVQLPANALARAIQDAIAVAVAFNFASTISASNLSGTNTGDETQARIKALGFEPYTTANLGVSATLSTVVTRFTAGSVAGTTPASPADFDELEISIEDASFTGCSLVANSGQTVNSVSSFAFNILPAVFRFRYNLAATNWFPTYYRIGTI